MGKTVFVDDSFLTNRDLFAEVAMRITCPTCSTQYEVDENDISFTGQDVQCSECMTIWNQTRNGEATNPRLADALAEDGEEISSEVEDSSDEQVDATAEEDVTPEEDPHDDPSPEPDSEPSDTPGAAIIEPEPAEDENDVQEEAEVIKEAPADQDEPIDDTEETSHEEGSTEENDTEVDPLDGFISYHDHQKTIEAEEQANEAQVEADEGDHQEETPEEELDEEEEIELTPPAPVEVETDVVETEEIEEGEGEADDDGDEEEDAIWKEIADLAQEARNDVDESVAESEEYLPPDDIPPIQSAPAVPEDADTPVDDEDTDERPWDAVTQENEGFSDFVWSDPSSGDDDDVKEAEADEEDASEFSQIADEPAGELEEMDDDLIAAALKEQMEIEDELEQAPPREERDIENIPVEMGGPRTRTPNVEALKDSVRSKRVELTKDEEKQRRPARRFRRGFSLTLLIFVLLVAIYVLRGQITEYLPATEPYLETYASFVDILRVQAEEFGGIVWELAVQGFDWVMAKVSG